MIDIPSQLAEAEFIRMRFFLEFQEKVHLRPETLLRLRKDLRRVAAAVLPENTLRGLFDPPLPVDPAALRRFQQPAPPFVLLPQPGEGRDWQPGEVLELPVLFLGRGVQLLESFADTLRALGAAGLYRGKGPFVLTEIAAEDMAGNGVSLWREGQPRDRLTPPLCDVRWWVDTPGAGVSELRLEFVTPARLMTAGKPLFRTDFAGIFPFILRRVTSMLFAHCGVEIVDDPAALFRAAARVVIVENRLLWEDWRYLEGPERRQDLGGIMGHLCLAGVDLTEILWILRCGALLNLGKGASFGAGSFRLTATS